MTVSYVTDFVGNHSFKTLRTLARWRGSIFKMLWKELFSYVGLFLIIGFSFKYIPRKYLMTDATQIIAQVAVSVDSFWSPVTLILSMIIRVLEKRRWETWRCIGWPDRLAFYISIFIRGKSTRATVLRQNIIRHANTMLVLILKSVSQPVAKRFPNFESLLKAGYITPNELKELEDMSDPDFEPRYMLPFGWCVEVIKEARKENFIKDDYSEGRLLEEFGKLRSKGGTLIGICWINFPIGFIQIGTVTVYSLALFCWAGDQFNTELGDKLSMFPGFYIPLSGLLKLTILCGLLKVCEILINPIGCNEEDIDTVWLIDRNHEVCFAIVDSLRDEIRNSDDDK